MSSSWKFLYDLTRTTRGNIPEDAILQRLIWLRGEKGIKGNIKGRRDSKVKTTIAWMNDVTRCWDIIRFQALEPMRKVRCVEPGKKCLAVPRTGATSAGALMACGTVAVTMDDPVRMLTSASSSL
jgi:hypothetical protein